MLAAVGESRHETSPSCANLRTSTDHDQKKLDSKFDFGYWQAVEGLCSSWWSKQETGEQLHERLHLQLRPLQFQPHLHDHHKVEFSRISLETPSPGTRCYRATHCQHCRRKSFQKEIVISHVKRSKIVPISGSQRSFWPFQLVITPPAPSTTGTKAR